MTKNKKLVYLSEEGLQSDILEAKIKKLKKKLKKCQKEKEEYLSQAQRARADFINYRQRQERQAEEFKKYCQAELIQEILPVLDSLEKGAQENKEIGIIKEQLKGALQKFGLREIEAQGKEFNPELHEALEQVESKKKSGVVVEEIQKGYLLGEKVLRPSKVRVAK